MNMKQRLTKLLGFVAQPTQAVSTDQPKSHKLRLRKLILLLASLTIFGFILFCAFRLEPHHLSSKEAFLGNLYRGKLIPFIHDNEKAKKYLIDAVKKHKTVEAQCDIADIYAAENNYKLAAAYYLRGAINGSSRCEAYFLKLSFTDSEDKVFQLLKNMADENKFPSAQYMVGIRLINGVGVSKKPKKGIAYLEKAVAQKHWGASVYLAGIYIKGELLPQDIKKANELLGVKNKIGDRK